MNGEPNHHNIADIRELIELRHGIAAHTVETASRLLAWELEMTPEQARSALIDAVRILDETVASRRP